MIDWNAILTNTVGGLFTGLPIVFAFWVAARGGYADAAEKAGKSLNELWSRYETLDKKYEEIDKRLSITMVYMVALIESHRRHNIIPPEPPDELRSDPDIIRLFETYKKQGRRNR